MIRVTVTGRPSNTGFMPYRIDSWAWGRPQFVGVSARPLHDACRQLQRAGLMNDTVVALYEPGDEQWIARTTVGYGAMHDKMEVQPVPTAAPYREFPGGPIKPSPSDVPPARSEEPPPPPHTPPEPQADTDQAPSAPSKLHQSHHPRKPKGSGARRGSR